MKFINYAIAAALLGLVVFTVSVSLSLDSLASFATFAGILFIASVVSDYLPRQARWEPNRHTACAHFPTRAHVIRCCAGALKLAS